MYVKISTNCRQLFRTFLLDSGGDLEAGVHGSLISLYTNFEGDDYKNVVNFF